MRPRPIGNGDRLKGDGSTLLHPCILASLLTAFFNFPRRIMGISEQECKDARMQGCKGIPVFSLRCVT